MMVDLPSRAHASRVLSALRRFGGRARFTPLRGEARVGDTQLSRTLEFLNGQGLVVGRPVAEGGRTLMEYALTRLGGEALDILDAWHAQVHGMDTPAARATDQELEAALA